MKLKNLIAFAELHKEFKEEAEVIVQVGERDIHFYDVENLELSLTFSGPPRFIIHFKQG